MFGTAAPAPRSRTALWRSDWNSGVGIPASRISCLASTLSVPRAQAAGGDPV